GGAMDGRAPQLRVGALHLSDVDPDLHLGRVSMQPAMGRQAALDADTAVDGIAGRVEDDEKAIAGVVDLAPMVLVEAAPHLCVQPRAEVGPCRVPYRLDQAGRAGQVGEHQSLAGGYGSRVRRQRGPKLFTRTDLELVVDMAQVVLDGLGTQVEPSRRLLRGRAFGQGERHLQLLRRELLAITVVAHARRLAAGVELGHRPLRPGRRAELVERLEGRAQPAPRVDPAARPAEALAEVQLRAGALEPVRGGLVMAHRGLELL